MTTVQLEDTARERLAVDSTSDVVTLSDLVPLTTKALSSASGRMSRQRRRDTDPELLLRHALFALGLRYRVEYPVPSRPRCTIDVAFPRAKVAVFVDGCFWHRCPTHQTHPKTNGEWWKRKLEANVERDRRVDAALVEQGWCSVRIWEHTTTESAVDQVLAALECVRSPAR